MQHGRPSWSPVLYILKKNTGSESLATGAQKETYREAIRTAVDEGRRRIMFAVFVLLFGQMHQLPPDAYPAAPSPLVRDSVKPPLPPVVSRSLISVHD